MALYMSLYKISQMALYKISQMTTIVHLGTERHKYRLFLQVSISAQLDLIAEKRPN